ncbi:hypothetical protein SAMN04487969_104188 [Paenibacillus algorifonticola]|uniref:Uncharacterized protein n=1 Tax=Paenibacillus algorifonticola TaxID=684063 RepID=A0A1I2C095_9BACL|nr:hypothetical protein SAMN04487969_104188 [Paenibacillus algorifonticola]
MRQVHLRRLAYKNAVFRGTIGRGGVHLAVARGECVGMGTITSDWPELTYCLSLFSNYGHTKKNRLYHQPIYIIIFRYRRLKDQGEIYFSAQ